MLRARGGHVRDSAGEAATRRVTAEKERRKIDRQRAARTAGERMQAQIEVVAARWLQDPSVVPTLQLLRATRAWLEANAKSSSRSLGSRSVDLLEAVLEEPGAVDRRWLDSRWRKLGVSIKGKSPPPALEELVPENATPRAPLLECARLMLLAAGARAALLEIAPDESDASLDAFVTRARRVQTAFFGIPAIAQIASALADAPAAAAG